MRLPKWPRWVWRCYAATFAAVAAFGICSQQRMWEIRCVGAYCTTVEQTSLCDFLAEAEKWNRPENLPNNFRFDWKTPAVITAVSVHLAAIAGALLGGVVWRKLEETSPPGPLSEPERGCSTCDGSGANAEQTEKNRS